MDVHDWCGGPVCTKMKSKPAERRRLVSVHVFVRDEDRERDFFGMRFFA